MIKTHIQLGTRSEEVRPVGAWVLPGNNESYAASNAVRQARLEEERLAALQKAKAAKLKAFQADVRKRVRLLEGIRQLQLLDKSVQSVQEEQNVIKHSADTLLPGKNGFSKRTDQHCAITSTPQVTSSRNAADDDGTTLYSQTAQVQAFNQNARKHLLSKKVTTEDFWDSTLPGGVWREGKTMDHPVARHYPALATTHELDAAGDSFNSEGKENVGTLTDKLQPGNFSRVIEASNSLSRSDVIAQKSATVLQGDSVQRAPSVPVVRPGVAGVEEQQRTAGQRATYRRLFMDIEREQVKENMRQRQHRDRMHKLKRDKELERKQVERDLNQASAVGPALAGDDEELMREREENARLTSFLTEQQRRKQRALETKRFLDALQRRLRDKMAAEGIELPALCMCGPTPWDTNPDTCANNCIFYKNPHAYAQALQTLLASHYT